MGYTDFFGKAPEILTVAASPAPTNQIFTVSSATNLAEGLWILVKVGSNFEEGKIASLSGNQVTLAAPLSGAPAVPGEVRNVRVLLSNRLFNGMGLFNADSVADLPTIDTTYAPEGLKYHVKDVGPYRWQSGSSLTAGGEDIVNSNYTGQWVKQETSGGAGDEGLTTWLALQVLELRDQIKKLQDKQPIHLTIPATIGIIAATTATTLKVPLPYMESAYGVVLTSLPILNQKLVLCGWCADMPSGYLYLRLYNTDATASRPFTAHLRLAFLRGL